MLDKARNRVDNATKIECFILSVSLHLIYNYNK